MGGGRALWGGLWAVVGGLWALGGTPAGAMGTGRYGRVRGPGITYGRDKILKKIRDTRSKIREIKNKNDKILKKIRK